MNQYVKKRLKRGLALCMTLASVGVLCVVLSPRELPTFARMTEQTLIIDPGHGGEDGGAVSASGQVESELNLNIALQLDSLMGFYGVRTVLTRTEDVSIHDADAKTIREKKVSDLHNRVALINATENATLISIHQNADLNKSCHGTQVFYADEVLSLPLARTVQDTVKQALDTENKRTPHAIPKSVYLMNHISCRAVLVECGFLSNPTEARLLKSKDYQMKLAMTLASSYIRCGDTQEGESLI